MQPLLIILLLLSVLTNVLLILLLLRSGQQNTAEDRTDEISRIVRDEVEAETEVLADQLRVMQGEVTRTTSASARDMGTLLAESQRQSQEAATARLDAIDRAGAARQRAANDALLAQLQVLETRLKNLEDTNANRLDGVRATLLQGMANIRADNNKKLDEIRGTVDEKLEATLQRRVSESFRAVSTQLEQVYKGLGEMQSLAAEDERYTTMNAYKNKRVIFCDLSQTPYRELAGVQPHFLLADFVRAFHPELLPNYTPKYYHILK